MFDCTPNPATRRYLIRMASASLLYMITVYISVRWLSHNPSTPWKYALALIPVVPTLFVPAAVVRLLREMDELQRKIQLDALAFAFAAAALLTLTYGFLQNAGLPALSWIWVWPVMSGCWIIGLIGARRRYR